jgi:anti-sigma factor RsiW
MVRNPAQTFEVPLGDEVLASHVRSAQLESHLVDIPSSDRHTVKPWFSGKLDFSPPIKDLAAESFPLVGGRLDYLGNRSVAVLVYRRHKHVIDLFIRPAVAGSSPTIRRQHRSGYNILAWTQDAMSFWAISDLNEKELTDFVELFRD